MSINVVAKDIWWFQPAAEKKVLKRWDKGKRAVCLVSPPGSGKTVIAGRIVKTAGFKRTVCITHTHGLVRNFHERLGIDTYTVQQLLWRGGIPGAPPDCVIWDECHHAGGERWGTVLDMAPKKAVILGLTGTPQRSDGKPLDRFDEMEVAAHYSELLMAGTIVPYRC